MTGAVPQASALEEAIARNARDLLRYLEYRVGPADAEDALGQTLLSAWRLVDRCPAASIEARLWLFGLARGVVLNTRRGARRRLSLVDRARALAVDAAAPGADRGIEVRDAVERLEPDQAELVRLLHWDGLTLAEAARLLGVPASTASARYQRARRELRAALGLADAEEHPSPPLPLPQQSVP